MPAMKIIEWAFLVDSRNLKSLYSFSPLHIFSFFKKITITRTRILSYLLLITTMSPTLSEGCILYDKHWISLKKKKPPFPIDLQHMISYAKYRCRSFSTMDRYLSNLEDHPLHGPRWKKTIRNHPEVIKLIEEARKKHVEKECERALTAKSERINLSKKSFPHRNSSVPDSGFKCVVVEGPKSKGYQIVANQPTQSAATGNVPTVTVKRTSGITVPKNVEREETSDDDLDYLDYSIQESLNTDTSQNTNNDGYQGIHVQNNYNQPIISNSYDFNLADNQTTLHDNDIQDNSYFKVQDNNHIVIDFDKEPVDTDFGDTFFDFSTIDDDIDYDAFENLENNEKLVSSSSDILENDDNTKVDQLEVSENDDNHGNDDSLEITERIEVTEDSVTSEGSKISDISGNNDNLESKENQSNSDNHSYSDNYSNSDNHHYSDTSDITSMSDDYSSITEEDTVDAPLRRSRRNVKEDDSLKIMITKRPQRKYNKTTKIKQEIDSHSIAARTRNRAPNVAVTKAEERKVVGTVKGRPRRCRTAGNSYVRQGVVTRNHALRLAHMRRSNTKITSRNEGSKKPNVDVLSIRKGRSRKRKWPLDTVEPSETPAAPLKSVENETIPITKRTQCLDEIPVGEDSKQKEVRTVPTLNNMSEELLDRWFKQLESREKDILQLRTKERIFRDKMAILRERELLEREKILAERERLVYENEKLVEERELKENEVHILGWKLITNAHKNSMSSRVKDNENVVNDLVNYGSDDNLI
ncbi:hypothetical protein BDB01DRAFT_770182 [Pilobolus umbonatus]|nr:hypothetical protein BDB01DRAFT_770182 [Pilobolus umbonatus]